MEAIINAARRGDNELLQRSGMSSVTSARDFKRMTPLMHAASAGHVSTVELLLHSARGAGCSVDEEDEERETALHKCCSAGKVDVASLLLRHGANFDKPNHRGATPLHHAAVKGASQLVALLLSAGANARATAGVRVI
jgi:ankyrin repeat protein